MYMIKYQQMHREPRASWLYELQRSTWQEPSKWNVRLIDLCGRWNHTTCNWPKALVKEQPKAKEINYRNLKRLALAQDFNDNETKQYESRTLTIYVNKIAVNKHKMCNELPSRIVVAKDRTTIASMITSNKFVII